jgi:hypothetical protein
MTDSDFTDLLAEVMRICRVFGKCLDFGAQDVAMNYNAIRANKRAHLEAGRWQQSFTLQQ